MLFMQTTSNQGPRDRYPWKKQQHEIGGSADVTNKKLLKMGGPVFRLEDSSVVFWGFQQLKNGLDLCRMKYTK